MATDLTSEFLEDDTQDVGLTPIIKKNPLADYAKSLNPKEEDASSEDYLQGYLRDNAYDTDITEENALLLEKEMAKESRKDSFLSNTINQAKFGLLKGLSTSEAGVLHSAATIADIADAGITSLGESLGAKYEYGEKSVYGNIARDLRNRVDEIIGGKQEVALDPKKIFTGQGASKTIGKGASELGKLEAEQKESVSEEFMGSLTGKVIEGAGQMAPTIATAFVTRDPRILFAQNFAQEYGDTLNELQEKYPEMTDGEIAIRAGAYGLLAGKLETASDIALVSRAVNKTTKNKAADILKNLGIKSLTEGATEGAQKVLQNFAVNAGRGPLNLSEGVAEEALLGGILGGAIGAPSTISSTLNRKQVAPNSQRVLDAMASEFGPKKTNTAATPGTELFSGEMNLADDTDILKVQSAWLTGANVKVNGRSIKFTKDGAEYDRSNLLDPNVLEDPDLTDFEGTDMVYDDDNSPVLRSDLKQKVEFEPAPPKVTLDQVKSSINQIFENNELTKSEKFEALSQLNQTMKAYAVVDPRYTDHYKHTSAELALKFIREVDNSESTKRGVGRPKTIKATDPESLKAGIEEKLNNGHEVGFSIKGRLSKVVEFDRQSNEFLVEEHTKDGIEFNRYNASELTSSKIKFTSREKIVNQDGVASEEFSTIKNKSAIKAAIMEAEASGSAVTAYTKSGEIKQIFGVEGKDYKTAEGLLPANEINRIVLNKNEKVGVIQPKTVSFSKNDQKAIQIATRTALQNNGTATITSDKHNLKNSRVLSVRDAGVEVVNQDAFTRKDDTSMDDTPIEPTKIIPWDELKSDQSAQVNINAPRVVTETKTVSSLDAYNTVNSGKPVVAKTTSGNRILVTGLDEDGDMLDYSGNKVNLDTVKSFHTAELLNNKAVEVDPRSSERAIAKKLNELQDKNRGVRNAAESISKIARRNDMVGSVARVLMRTRGWQGVNIKVVNIPKGATYSSGGNYEFAGAYDPYTKTITINLARRDIYQNDDGSHDVDATLIHELTHASFDAMIFGDYQLSPEASKAITELEKIMGDFKDSTKSDPKFKELHNRIFGQEGNLNQKPLREFLAELLVNPQLQKHLANRTGVDSRPILRRIWDAIVSVLTGKPVNKNSQMADAFSGFLTLANYSIPTEKTKVKQETAATDITELDQEELDAMSDMISYSREYEEDYDTPTDADAATDLDYVEESDELVQMEPITEGERFGDIGISAVDDALSIVSDHAAKVESVTQTALVKAAIGNKNIKKLKEIGDTYKQEVNEAYEQLIYDIIDSNAKPFEVIGAIKAFASDLKQRNTSEEAFSSDIKNTIRAGIHNYLKGGGKLSKRDIDYTKGRVAALSPIDNAIEDILPYVTKKLYDRNNGDVANGRFDEAFVSNIYTLINNNKIPIEYSGKIVDFAMSIAGDNIKANDNARYASQSALKPIIKKFLDTKAVIDIKRSDEIDKIMNKSGVIVQSKSAGQWVTLNVNNEEVSVYVRNLPTPNPGTKEFDEFVKNVGKEIGVDDMDATMFSEWVNDPIERGMSGLPKGFFKLYSAMYPRSSVYARIAKLGAFNKYAIVDRINSEMLDTGIKFNGLPDLVERCKDKLFVEVLKQKLPKDLGVIIDRIKSPEFSESMNDVLYKNAVRLIPSNIGSNKLTDEESYELTALKERISETETMANAISEAEGNRSITPDELNDMRSRLVEMGKTSLTKNELRRFRELNSKLRAEGPTVFYSVDDALKIGGKKSEIHTILQSELASFEKNVKRLADNITNATTAEDVVAAISGTYTEATGHEFLYTDQIKSLSLDVSNSDVKNTATQAAIALDAVRKASVEFMSNRSAPKDIFDRAMRNLIDSVNSYIQRKSEFGINAVESVREFRMQREASKWGERVRLLENKLIELERNIPVVDNVVGRVATGSRMFGYRKDVNMTERRSLFFNVINTYNTNIANREFKDNSDFADAVLSDLVSYNYDLRTYNDVVFLSKERGVTNVVEKITGVPQESLLALGDLDDITLRSYVNYHTKGKSFEAYVRDRLTNLREFRPKLESVENYRTVTKGSNGARELRDVMLEITRVDVANQALNDENHMEFISSRRSNPNGLTSGQVSYIRDKMKKVRDTFPKEMLESGVPEAVTRRINEEKLRIIGKLREGIRSMNDVAGGGDVNLSASIDKLAKTNVDVSIDEFIKLAEGINTQIPQSNRTLTVTKKLTSKLLALRDGRDMLLESTKKRKREIRQNPDTLDAIAEYTSWMMDGIEATLVNIQKLPTKDANRALSELQKKIDTLEEIAASYKASATQSSLGSSDKSGASIFRTPGSGNPFGYIFSKGAAYTDKVFQRTLPNPLLNNYKPNTSENLNDSWYYSGQSESLREELTNFWDAVESGQGLFNAQSIRRVERQADFEENYFDSYKVALKQLREQILVDKESIGGSMNLGSHVITKEEPRDGVKVRSYDYILHDVSRIINSDTAPDYAAVDEVVAKLKSAGYVSNTIARLEKARSVSDITPQIRGKYKDMVELYDTLSYVDAPITVRGVVVKPRFLICDSKYGKIKSQNAAHFYAGRKKTIPSELGDDVNNLGSDNDNDKEVIDKIAREVVGGKTVALYCHCGIGSCHCDVIRRGVANRLKELGVTPGIPNKSTYEIDDTGDATPALKESDGFAEADDRALAIANLKRSVDIAKVTQPNRLDVINSVANYKRMYGSQSSYSSLADRTLRYYRLQNLKGDITKILNRQGPHQERQEELLGAITAIEQEIYGVNPKNADNTNKSQIDYARELVKKAEEVKKPIGAVMVKLGNTSDFERNQYGSFRLGDKFEKPLDQYEMEERAAMLGYHGKPKITVTGDGPVDTKNPLELIGSSIKRINNEIARLKSGMESRGQLSNKAKAEYKARLKELEDSKDEAKSTLAFITSGSVGVNFEIKPIEFVSTDAEVDMSDQSTEDVIDKNLDRGGVTGEAEFGAIEPKGPKFLNTPVQEYTQIANTQGSYNSDVTKQSSLTAAAKQNMRINDPRISFSLASDAGDYARNTIEHLRNGGVAASILRGLNRAVFGAARQSGLRPAVERQTEAKNATERITSDISRNIKAYIDRNAATDEGRAELEKLTKEFTGSFDFGITNDEYNEAVNIMRNWGRGGNRISWDDAFSGILKRKAAAYTALQSEARIKAYSEHPELASELDRLLSMLQKVTTHSGVINKHSFRVQLRPDGLWEAISGADIIKGDDTKTEVVTGELKAQTYGELGVAQRDNRVDEYLDNHKDIEAVKDWLKRIAVDQAVLADNVSNGTDPDTATAVYEAYYDREFLYQKWKSGLKQSKNKGIFDGMPFAIGLDYRALPKEVSDVISGKDNGVSFVIDTLSKAMNSASTHAFITTMEANGLVRRPGFRQGVEQVVPDGWLDVPDRFDMRGAIAHKDVIDALNEMYPDNKPGVVNKSFRKIMGMANAAATIGSPITGTTRNGLSGAVMQLCSGNWNPRITKDAIARSFRYFLSEGVGDSVSSLTKGKVTVKELRDRKLTGILGEVYGNEGNYSRALLENGLRDQEASLAMRASAAARISDPKSTESDLIGGNPTGIRKLPMAAKTLTNVAGAWYQSPDNAFKDSCFNYILELELSAPEARNADGTINREYLKKAEGRAAEYTKQRFPTATRTLNITKKLNSIGLGQFVAYVDQASQIAVRNPIYDTITLGYDNSESIRKIANKMFPAHAKFIESTPDSVKSGYKKTAARSMAAYALFSALPILITGITRALGIDDEEEREYRSMLPPYEQNSTSLLLYRSGGKIRHINLESVNFMSIPWAPISVAFGNFMRDKEIEDTPTAIKNAVGTWMYESINPWITPQIAMKAAVEAYTNQRESGGEVVNPTDTEFNKLVSKIAHVARPMFIPSGLNPILPGKGFVTGVDSKGKEVNRFEIVNKLLNPLPSRTVEFDKAATTKFYEYSRVLDDAQRLFRTAMKTGDKDKALSALEQTNSVFLRTSYELVYVAAGLAREGKSPSEIKTMLRTSGVPSYVADAILSRNATGFAPTKKSIQMAELKHEGVDIGSWFDKYERELKPIK